MTDRGPLATQGDPARLLTIPNLLSLARLAAMPVFVVLFATSRHDAAVVLFAIAAWTDFFDGYIARRTGSVTNLGKLLDPVADRAFILALAVALLVDGVLPWGLAAAIVARDVFVLAGFGLLARRKIEPIPVNFTGKSATAALLFGLGWYAWSRTGFAFAESGDLFGIVFVTGGVVLYWIAGVQYALVAAARLRADASEAQEAP